MNNTKWTIEEERIIESHYWRLGKRGLAQSGMLPLRSADSIRNKAQAMGLCASQFRKGGGAAPSDDFHALPVHDYTDADYAMRDWRYVVQTGSLRARL